MAAADQARDTMRRNIQSLTGTSVAEWKTRIRKKGLERHGEIVRWLKAEHGITHGYANFIALEATHGNSANASDQVASLFRGPKAKLRPLYDQLTTMMAEFGPDVEIAPKKANVSMRRKRQFALLQPSTADRLDVGLILKGVKPTSRLERSRSFNAMCTHRVRVASAEDVDDELKMWLKRAYDAAG